MSKVKISISCCLCSEKYETEIEVPSQWVPNRDLDDEFALCPKHSVIQEFQGNCGGCVGGWGDCDLWMDFAHSKQNLTDKDFEVICSGRCPRRVNGTLMSSPGRGIESIDISERGTKESGVALEKAIREYWKRYKGV